jgi:hypothetical protein
MELCTRKVTIVTFVKSNKFVTSVVHRCGCVWDWQFLIPKSKRSVLHFIPKTFRQRQGSAPPRVARSLGVGVGLLRHRNFVVLEYALEHSMCGHGRKVPEPHTKQPPWI